MWMRLLMLTALLFAYAVPTVSLAQAPAADHPVETAAAPAEVHEEAHGERPLVEFNPAEAIWLSLGSTGPRQRLSDLPHPHRRAPDRP